MSKKLIRETKYFRFMQSKHSPPGNQNALPLYIIAVNNWANIDMEEVRNIIDPNRNISGKNGVRWKFKKYEDADKIWVYLTLKYS